MNQFTPHQKGAYIHTLTQPQTAVQALHQALNEKVSQRQLKQWMQNGCVWLTPNHHPNQTDRLRRAKKPLKTADTLHLYFDHKLQQTPPPTPTLIADLGQYSVWYKPKGMLSQGSKWGDHHALHRWVAQHDAQQRQTWIVHRLDRATDGLMLIAHSKKMAQQLSERFASRQTEKHYLAWVQGHFKTVTSSQLPIDGKPAISHFSPLYYDVEHQATLLTIHIETGRKHQIRKHLQALKHPILGDRLYGQADENTIDLQLTAYQLAFPCPITQKIQRLNLCHASLSPLINLLPIQKSKLCQKLNEAQILR